MVEVVDHLEVLGLQLSSLSLHDVILLLKVVNALFHPCILRIHSFHLAGVFALAEDCRLL